MENPGRASHTVGVVHVARRGRGAVEGLKWAPNSDTASGYKGTPISIRRPWSPSRACHTVTGQWVMGLRDPRAATI